MKSGILRILLAMATFGLAFAFTFLVAKPTLFQEIISSIGTRTQTAAVFVVDSITPEQLLSLYHNPAVNYEPIPNSTAKKLSAQKIKVLIVPGHEPNDGGTEFRGIYERNIVVDIANKLANLLRSNPHYDVMVARDDTSWNPTLANFFTTNANAIEQFRTALVQQMNGLLADGSILSETDQVYHNTASSKAALHLYGINKWADDNHYDITLHLHINDYPTHRHNTIGIYDGFSIYVPDTQFSNARASTQIANNIAVRLNAYHATSTLPIEKAGVIPDQQLIAVGSNNSVKDAAVLIEYGYIYEPQLLYDNIRNAAETDYAYETYLGLQDFFQDPVTSQIDFPPEFLSTWQQASGELGTKGSSTYALQEVLHYLGYYPPKGKSFSDSPISGLAGACTKAAIQAFQEENTLPPVGVVGPATQKALETALAQ